MCLSVLYAFACQIRLGSRAGKLSRWVQSRYPEAWNELNAVARSWQGGHPALKVLHGRRRVDSLEFRQRYRELRDLEVRLLVSLAIACICLLLILAGSEFWGWHW